MTGHISLFAAQWRGTSTRFDCLCKADKIPAKRWLGYRLAGTRLVSFYLAKPKPAQIEIGRDRSPSLSPAPQAYASEKGEKLDTCFIDLPKAFDTVWRPGVLVNI